MTLKCQDAKMTKLYRMQNLSLYISVILVLWLIAVSIFLYRFLVLYKRLTKGVDVEDLKKVLEKLLANGEENTKSIKEIIGKINSIEEADKRHIQKVGLVRFNPFRELGGDHSFSLAILDDRNNGVVITGLHTRERTRIYMKDIKGGKSTLELSNEEQKAVASAEKSK